MQSRKVTYSIMLLILLTVGPVVFGQSDMVNGNLIQFNSDGLASLGDVNGDGIIDIVDALLTAQYYVELNPSPFISTNADVDCNGIIDIIDALLIARYYVRLMTEFSSCGLYVDPRACASAADQGRNIAYNILNRGDNGNRYATVCSWFGVNLYSELTGDNMLLNGSKNEFAPYINRQLHPHIGHVDNNVFGIWPFGLYQQTNNSEYLDMGVYLADEEYSPPRPNGLCRYTRYWVDDIYMICSLQAQTYKAAGNCCSIINCAFLTTLLKVYISYFSVNTYKKKIKTSEQNEKCACNPHFIINCYTVIS